MSGDELIVTRDGGIVRLTLNRPERRNALTPELIGRLGEELDRIESSPETRVVIVTGSPPAFCAGFDIERIESPGGADAGAERDLVEQLCSRVRTLRAPVIAKVGGVASGTGCDLAVSCDLRFAAEGAQLSMPPAKLGVLYSWQGIGRLVAAVGPAAAKELLFAGGLVDAERALRIGLVDRIYPADRLDEETERFAELVAANAPLSVAASKLIVNLLAERSPLSDALAPIIRASDEVWASEDAREGPRAFQERRPPRFAGR